MNWIIVETTKGYYIHEKGKPFVVKPLTDFIGKVIKKAKAEWTLEYYYIHELNITIYIPIIKSHTRSLISKWCYEYIDKIEEKYNIPHHHIENIKITIKCEY
jgi:hypothetical protein